MVFIAERNLRDEIAQLRKCSCSGISNLEELVTGNVLQIEIGDVHIQILLTSSERLEEPSGNARTTPRTVYDKSRIAAQA